MNGWGWAALSLGAVAALFVLGSAVGRLFVVDPYPQDEDEKFSAMKQALGGDRR